jgi:hypothetical protein
MGKEVASGKEKSLQGTQNVTAECKSASEA